MLSTLSFAHPWVLMALAGLPALWWLLKLIPPKPQRVNFPPIQFLLKLRDEASTTSSMPLWLLALRLFILTLIIIALAGPELRRSEPVTEGKDPLLLLIDNGWATAHNWETRKEVALSFVDEAAAKSRSLLVVPTAPDARITSGPGFLAPRQARDFIKQLAPHPWATQRLPQLNDALSSLPEGSAEGFEVIWLTDGLADQNQQDLQARLAELGPVRVLDLPGLTGALTLQAPEVFADKLVLHLTRTDRAFDFSGEVRALDSKGATLALAPFEFSSGENTTKAVIELPLELRNRIARVTVEDHTAAAATFILDERWRRRSVGIVSQRTDIEKPLLSEIYYIDRALAPYAEVEKADLRQLLTRDLDTIFMPDLGALSESEVAALTEWMRAGGTLVRFSSPRIAADPFALTPVHLRSGNRALGGALSWDTPQPLGPFPETSPFSGLTAPEEVTISQQVLAEPSVDLSQKTWAQLADGTPIVTAAPEEQGWLVLFHVTANPDWSNLPLSGLYVEMLRRIIDFSANEHDAPSQNAAGPAVRLTPDQLLDGFGNFLPPAAGHQSFELSKSPWTSSPQHPPGLYKQGSLTKALNLGMSDLSSAPLSDLPQGFEWLEVEAKPLLRLTAALLTLSFLLVILDGIAVLMLSGGLTLKPALKTSVLALGLLRLVSAEQAQAQDATPKELQAALETRLAYVVTGDSSLDAISQAGLEGLTMTLRQRTAAEPGKPFGLNLQKDDLSFYPLVYFPVRAKQPLLAPEAVEKLNAYMARGGTLLIDSGDHQLTAGFEGTALSPDSARMQQILRQLDVPPLTKVPSDHVLTKSFYLIQEFPGRWTGGALWVEAAPETSISSGASNDGVSSILIGSNDYAAAWAVDERGKPRLPLVPGGPSQREGAMRFGVNLVLYTLTGNYKADQVHVPALLERLGQ